VTQADTIFDGQSGDRIQLVGDNVKQCILGRGVTGAVIPPVSSKDIIWSIITDHFCGKGRAIYRLCVCVFEQNDF